MSRKFLEELAVETRLSYSPNERMVHGNYNGFYVIISLMENAKRAVVTAFANFEVESGSETSIRKRAEESVALFSSSNSYVNYYYIGVNYIKAEVRDSTVARNKNNVMDVLNNIISILSENRLYSCCTNCEATIGLSAYKIGDAPDYLCDNCFGEVAKKIPKARKKSKNPLVGILCALLGSLVGGILWVIAYQSGYVVAIVGLVTFVLAYKGYTLFHNCKAKTAVIVSSITSVVMLFLAHYFSWAIDVYNAFKNDFYITFLDALKSIPLYIIDPEFTGDFFTDLVIGYVFMAAACFSFIITELKNPKLGQRITKLEY